LLFVEEGDRSLLYKEQFHFVVAAEKGLLLARLSVMACQSKI
jgi:hypothetical protein